MQQFIRKVQSTITYITVCIIYINTYMYELIVYTSGKWIEVGTNYYKVFTILYLFMV